MSSATLDALADLHGILPTFTDLAGVEQPTSDATKRALLRAEGVNPSDPIKKIEREGGLGSPAGFTSLVVEAGKPFRQDLVDGVENRWELFDEEAARSIAKGSDAIDFPALAMGYYDLKVWPSQGGSPWRHTVIAAPARAPSVQDITKRDRLWGVTAAAYGLHSTKRGGPGTYRHLSQAAASLGGKGAGFIGINPAHAMGFGTRYISPYSPSHRGFLDTRMIDLDMLGRHGKREAKALEGGSPTPLIDYETQIEAHEHALRAIFARWDRKVWWLHRNAFEQFLKKDEGGLSRFIRYEALAETHGPDWTAWPEHLQDAAALDDAPMPPAARFHAWLQYEADEQLRWAQRVARRKMKLGLYLDLAVGARRDGAEAWANRDAIAPGVSIGAPPDHLSPAGQKWNLTAFSPRRLRQTKYRAFRDLLARNMRHCGVLRIDHVLGLARSFWIPDDGSPGGYITHDMEALLAIVRLEAVRADCVIIGEDLGLVPDGLRAALSASNLYSYSVLQYEREDGRFRETSSLNPQSLACFATHDTPTIAGYVAGRDIDWWHRLGWTDDAATKAARTERARDVKQLPGRHDIPTADALHEELARSPAALVAVQWDDLEDRVEAQNLPGTVHEHPNWQRRSDTPVEGIARHEGLARTAAIMEKAGR